MRPPAIAATICRNRTRTDEEHDGKHDDLADDSQETHVPIERTAPYWFPRSLNHRNRSREESVHTKNPRSDGHPSHRGAKNALLAEGWRVHQATVRPELVGTTYRLIAVSTKQIIVFAVVAHTA